MADFALVQTLCALRGISGREEAVRAKIIEEIRPYAEYHVDRLGNLIVEKKGRQRPKKRVLLDAHMDEVGLIVTAIDGDGLLHFATVGGINGKVLAGIQVLVGDKALPGVIGVKPVHLCAKEEREKPVATDQLVIDLGVSNKEEAEKLAAPGDMVTFVSPFYTQEERMFGKAFDDRAGCALLIEMIRSEMEYDMTFSFSVQEEIGLRGAKASAFAVQPDVALVVESTTAGDLAGVAPEKQVCHVGKGPAVSFMDNRTIYDRGLYALAFRLAAENGIAVQAKEAVAGGNNAGSIHAAACGVRTLAVSLPCRYLHAPIGMIAQNDYRATLALLKLLGSCV